MSPSSDLSIPPHSIEAEQAVLGGLMLDNNAWNQVADRVGEQDFYRHNHRQIFQAIASLAKRNKPFDVVTMSEWISENAKDIELGTLSYLGTLAKDTPSAANIKAYADIIREKSTNREAIAIGNALANGDIEPSEAGIKLKKLESRKTSENIFPNISKLSCDLWEKREPEPLEDIVKDCIHASIPTLLAAIGGVGKSHQLLDLFIKVAAFEELGQQFWLGYEIVKGGHCVLLTYEDDTENVRRRIKSLAEMFQIPDVWYHSNLTIIPMLDYQTEEPFFWVEEHGHIRSTSAWSSFCNQLEAIHKQKPIVLIGLDPLQRLAALDLNIPAYAQAVSTDLSRPAAKLGCGLITTHHMNKAKGLENASSLMDVRAAIRGTTGLVDGMRSVRAMWPMDEKDEKENCKQLGLRYSPGCLVKTATVKANIPTDHSTHILYRRPSGRLEDITNRVEKGVQHRKDAIPELDLYPQVAHFLRDRAKSGQYFTQNKLAEQHTRFGIGERKFKNILSDWEHNKQLRRIKADGQKNEVLMPPEAWQKEEF